MDLNKAALDGWRDFSTNLTWRQRAELLAALDSGRVAADPTLLEVLTADLRDTHEVLVGDWTILDDAGPLDRDGLLAQLGILGRHLESYSHDREQVTQGLLIALLRYVQPDAELYERIREGAGAAVLLEELGD